MRNVVVLFTKDTLLTEVFDHDNHVRITLDLLAPLKYV